VLLGACVLFLVDNKKRSTHLHSSTCTNQVAIFSYFFTLKYPLLLNRK
jgi:hypothetical protein